MPVEASLLRLGPAQPLIFFLSQSAHGDVMLDPRSKHGSDRALLVQTHSCSAPATRHSRPGMPFNKQLRLSRNPAALLGNPATLLPSCTPHPPHSH